MGAMLDGITLGCCSVDVLMGDTVGAMLDGVILGCFSVDALLRDTFGVNLDALRWAAARSVRYWEIPWERCWMASRWAAAGSMCLCGSDAGWRHAGLLNRSMR